MTRNVRLGSEIRLQFQSLECRQLFAVAEFTTQIWTDVNGVPGQEIVDQTLATGQSFFLKIDVQEFDRHRLGLQSIAVDVQWDASLLEVVSEDFILADVLTPELPLWQLGRLDQSAGAITNLGATVGIIEGRPIGNGISENFALIRMRAGDLPGTASIDLHKSQLKTILYPTAVLGRDHVKLTSETITIVPSDLPLNEASDSQVVELIDSVTVAEVMDEEIVVLKIEQSPVEQSDSILSFDANNDGVFDLADLGWINVMATSSSAAPVDAPAMTSAASNQRMADAMESPVTVDHSRLATETRPCLAFPELGNVAAAERWLDAFAEAWIADEDVRARRRAVVTR